ncbi:serine hydrolase domain-containing protein [Psychromonas aquimarina]|uniref:serine hydrolase domain-containing protein n=1 Tax=Psychromonas aquimarina TaxID=444919 RepID=UPI0004111293|nr:serine hydrolase domain-containing protein [Psychromonas aquimarina]
MRVVVYILAVSCFLISGQSFAGSESSEQTAMLNNLVHEWAVQLSVPSVMLRVEDAGGLIYAGAAGQASFNDLTPVKPDSYFRTASVGKLFTAVTVLRLHERGRLSLNDTVDKYLDADLVARLHVYKGRSYGNSITIKQLLSHSSGLPNTDDNPAFGRWLMKYPQKNRMPQELLEYAIQIGPEFAPGEGQRYSSPGYTLLGLIIERVTKKPYYQVVREEVLTPLGLKNTFEETHELPGYIKPVHSYVSDYDMNQIHSSMEFADGGFVTTAADLTKFALALNSGKTFIHADTLASALKLYGSESIGLGPFVGGAGTSQVFFYHPGHWGVLLYVDRSKQLVIVYTVNQGKIDYSALLDQVIEILNQ